MPLLLLLLTRSYEQSPRGPRNQGQARDPGNGGPSPRHDRFSPPLPVVSVPVKICTLSGEDSLLSIVQIPPGVPMATGTYFGCFSNLRFIPPIRLHCQVEISGFIPHL